MKVELFDYNLPRELIASQPIYPRHASKLLDLSEENKITDLTSYFMPDSNLELHAKWQINQYTITLIINHKNNTSTFDSVTKDYGYDISYLKASNPSFEGYTFQGWNNGTIVIASNATIITQAQVNDLYLIAGKNGSVTLNKSTSFSTGGSSI